MATTLEFGDSNLQVSSDLNDSELNITIFDLSIMLWAFGIGVGVGSGVGVGTGVGVEGDDARIDVVAAGARGLHCRNILAVLDHHLVQFFPMIHVAPFHQEFKQGERLLGTFWIWVNFLEVFWIWILSFWIGFFFGLDSFLD